MYIFLYKVRRIDYNYLRYQKDHLNNFRNFVDEAFLEYFLIINTSVLSHIVKFYGITSMTPEAIAFSSNEFIYFCRDTYLGAV